MAGAAPMKQSWRTGRASARSRRAGPQPVVVLLADRLVDLAPPDLASLDGSATMNLSFGERPVCLPVRTTSGPSAAIRPSPERMASSYSSAVEQVGPDGRGRGRRRAWRLWWPSAVGLPVRRRSRSDRPAARDAARGSAGVGFRSRTLAEATTLRNGCGPGSPQTRGARSRSGSCSARVPR